MPLYSPIMHFEECLIKQSVNIMSIPIQVYCSPLYYLHPLPHDSWSHTLPFQCLVTMVAGDYLPCSDLYYAPCLLLDYSSETGEDYFPCFVSGFLPLTKALFHWDFVECFCVAGCGNVHNYPCGEDWVGKEPSSFHGKFEISCHKLLKLSKPL